MTQKFIPTLLALSISGVMLSGCSSMFKSDTEVVPEDRVLTNSQPSWVTAPPQRANVAYGVGSMEVYGSPDQALKRASDFARADLVSRLKVTISGTNSSSINEYSFNGETRLQKNISQVVSSKIPTVTLDELVIEETFVDDKYAYALAKLDRAAAAARLSQQIAATETELRSMASTEISGETKLARLQQQLPAMGVFAQRDQLAEQYAFIDTSRIGPSLPNDLKAYRQDILASLKELQVNLVLLDDGAKIMRGGLAEAFTAQGLRLGNNSNTDLTFEVSATLDSQKSSGNVYVFANARVNLRDTDGKILSSFAKKARGVSGLQQNALNKASEKLAQLLSDELAATLTERLQ
jgi:hypothetical protein